MFKHVPLIPRALLLVAGICSYSLHASVYDNRYFPWFDFIFSRTWERPSHSASSVFFITSDKAVGQLDKDIGIPELWGCFDQLQLSRALDRIGIADPLPIEYRVLKELPYTMEGQLRGAGLAFQAEQAIGCGLSCGLAFGFLHLDSVIDLCLKRDIIRDLNLEQKEGNRFELDRALREGLCKLGLEGLIWSARGITDIDFFVRYGYIWEYICKMRRLDVGIKFGGIAPTGKERNINNPASIPFGGDDHWGFYIEPNFEAELKEDWKFGVIARFTHRFGKDQILRMPVAGEPMIFGAVVGRAFTQPGFTAIVSPYATLEGIRDGLGIQARWTVGYHQRDTICDRRDCRNDDGEPQECIPVTLGQTIELSEWIKDYFSIKLFYDFGKAYEHPRYCPQVFLAWDFASPIISARQYCRTHRISLGFELSF